MSKLPRFASRVLQAFGVDPALIGDLEEASAGRSRAWCWRQVAGIVATSAVGHTLSPPISTTRVLVSGWTTLLIVLTLFTFAVAMPARIAAAQAGQPPQGGWWLTAGYATLALSALALIRLRRTGAGAPLVLGTATVLMAMVVGFLVVEVFGLV